MGLIDRVKANYHRNPRAWGGVSAFIGMMGAFGWKISCGILCVIILNQFLKD